MIDVISKPTRGPLADVAEYAKTNVNVVGVSCNMFFHGVKCVVYPASISAMGDGHNDFDCPFFSHRVYTSNNSAVYSTAQFCFYQEVFTLLFAKKGASSSMALKHHGALTSVSVHNSCVVAFFR